MSDYTPDDPTPALMSLKEDIYFLMSLTEDDTDLQRSSTGADLIAVEPVLPERVRWVLSDILAVFAARFSRPSRSDEG